MANEMIKFYRGLVGNLPATGVNGALYITTDEGGIYYGTGDGMKRLGDFIQVDEVSKLPENAHTTCLYYCVKENILCRYTGSEWKQINKQPTADELKVLLGLGSLAYISEVTEANLSSELAEKVNAASEGNHAHLNKGVLDGITAEKVSAWDAAEGNAKGYADGLNGAMDTRVKAVEEAKHTHSNKDLLDTYTQTEANLADAVAKKHEHSNKTELDKIVAGDVAKWNGVVADHLTSVDKTALEDAIGDVSTALGGEVERAKAAEKANADAIVAIKDGTIVDSFADVETELGKKVDKVEGKSLILDTEIERLATLSNYDDTAIRGDIDKKADSSVVEGELAKKVDKVTGYSLVSDTEIARLAEVDNYDDTAIRGDIDKKADSATMTTELGKKVDKVDGYSLVSDVEIARLADVDNYDDSEVRGLIGDNADAIAEIVGDYVKSADIADFETKGNVKKVSDDLAAYIESNDAAIADRYTKEEADGKFALIADAYDDSELVGRVKAIEDDYLTSSDKEDLQTQINTIMNNPDAEGAINSINEFTQYVKDHGTIADGFRTDIDKNKEDIAANAKAISDHEALAGETYETKDDASNKLTEAKGYTDTEVAKDRERIATLEAIDHDAYKAAIEEVKVSAANQDAVVLAESQKYTDTAKAEAIADAEGKVKALADGQVTTNKNDIADLFAQLQWGEF